ncbi:hypothetical protein DXG03_001966 [Asterophora parasitica]|uniref:Uncharacterized protein n=1 Tax=Asterophora parasitica TaxID=117018 RepID=A0A9P7KFI1_9AGAR|nr:hypothetical protein DXG03_001966 [Asterophora parasitica]
MAEEIIPDPEARRLYLSLRPRTLQGKLAEVWDWVYEQSNFFRIHLSAFVIIPLILSGIFYASNGQYHVRYIDSLFLCYSAMTGTGLATLNLSNITGFQQAFLRSECGYLYWELNRKLDSEKGESPKIETSEISAPSNIWRHDFDINTPPMRPPGIETSNISAVGDIWRHNHVSTATMRPPGIDVPADSDNVPRNDHHMTDGVLSSSPSALSVELPPISPTQSALTWHQPDVDIRVRQRRPQLDVPRRTGQPTIHNVLEPRRDSRRRSMMRSMSTITVRGPFSPDAPGAQAKHQGLGGFPGPLELIHKAVKSFTPKTYRKIYRTMTLQTMNTVEVAGVKAVRTGRNSDIDMWSLPDEEVEKLAGLDDHEEIRQCLLRPAAFDTEIMTIRADLGLPVFEDLPVGVRVVGGLFQGIAVRASGLTFVPIGELAPAVQFLYVVMMYIAVYPVGLCIRATNVYEEKSLGIFEVDEGELTDDLRSMGVAQGLGRYLGWHMRHQMTVDIWWLVWGIMLVAIIERGNIMNAEKPYIALFPIIFELVSAFAGIGLSLGWPGDNFSLVGTMRPLSKLVIIVIMYATLFEVSSLPFLTVFDARIRGRHRGLPVAVDRAILFPDELVTGSDRKATMDASTMKDVPAPA